MGPKGRSRIFGAQGSEAPSGVEVKFSYLNCNFNGFKNNNFPPPPTPLPPTKKVHLPQLNFLEFFEPTRNSGAHGAKPITGLGPLVIFLGIFLFWNIPIFSKKWVYCKWVYFQDFYKMGIFFINYPKKCKIYLKYTHFFQNNGYIQMGI